MPENLCQKISQDLARILQDYAGFLQEKVLFYCKNQNPAGFTEILQDFCKNLARLTCTDPAGSCKMVSTGVERLTSV